MDGYIVDKGLFKDNTKYRKKISESLLVIENWMNTIGEYLIYAQPNTPSWDEYFQAVFQVMGFTVQKVNQRIFEVKNSSGNVFPCAVVGSVNPGENFDVMVPGLSWDNFLFYVANYHQVEWGILFNGSEMKILNLKRNDYQLTFVTVNLQKILSDKQVDSFMDFCNILSIIGKDPNNKPLIIQNPLRKELEELLPEFRIHQLKLSRRELEILQIIDTGMTNNEIAENTGLANGVIRNYLSSIYKKLEVKNRTEAVKKARDLGLIVG